MEVIFANLGMGSPHHFLHKLEGFTMDQVVPEKLQKIIAEQLGIDESVIKPTSSIKDDLGADSLDTVELVMVIEGEYDIQIPDELAEKITTVQHIMDYIAEHGK
jgi:acyl carrier protein